MCPQCESKIESGELTKADADASMNLAKIAKSNKEIENFTLYSCKEFDGNFVLSLAKNDIMIIRQSRTIISNTARPIQRKNLASRGRRDR